MVELSSDGVSKIETKGGKFDPTKMEAITTLPPSEDFPANTVIDELESGYMYKDRVLIPARVVWHPSNNFRIIFSEYSFFLGLLLLPCFFRTALLMSRDSLLERAA